MKTHPRYEVFEEIGRGETAVVYRGRDMNLKIPVAIKEFRDELRGDTRLFEQFCRTAQALAGLGRHDHIVLVREVDRNNGWIILDLMRESLEDVLNREKVSIAMVRSILRQCLAGLKVLHEHGMLHGSVKPANLLVDDHGLVRLSDCSGTSADGELPAPRGGYKAMAPELCDPSFGPVGPPIDLYGAGFSALELLMGQAAFVSWFAKAGVDARPNPADGGMSWLRWHGSREEVLPPTAMIVPSLPPDLAQALDGLLQKEVARRFATADEALKALDERPILLFDAPDSEDAEPSTPPENLTQGYPGVPAPVAPTVPPVRTPGRPASGPATAGGPAPWSRDWLNQKLSKPAILIPTLILVILMMGGPAYFVVMKLQGDSQKKPAATNPPPKVTINNVVKQGPPPVAQPKPKPPQIVIATPPETKVTQTTKEDAKKTDTNNNVVVANVPNPAPQPPEDSPPKPTPEIKLPPSPEEPPQRKPFVTEWQAHGATVFGVAASGDGKTLITGGGDELVRVWDMGPVLAGDSKTPRMRMEHRFGAKVYDVAISADGRRAIIAGESPTIAVLELDGSTAREVHSLKTHGTRTWKVALRADGQLALSGGQDRGVWRWDFTQADSAHVTKPLFTNDEEVTAIALDPEAHWGLCGDWSGVVRYFQLRTRHVRDVRAHKDVVKHIAFAPPPHSRRVVTCGENKAIVWDLEANRRIAVLEGHEDLVTSAVFTRDSFRILTTSYDKTVRLWSATDGQFLGFLPGHADSIEDAAVLDERYAVTAGKDNLVILWDLQAAPAAPAQAAEDPPVQKSGAREAAK